jgi:hypothetical protein
MGREVVVAITNGRLDFGPWEQIFYGEFDGGLRKWVLVKIVGEQATPGVSVFPFSSQGILHTYCCTKSASVV